LAPAFQLCTMWPGPDALDHITDDFTMQAICDFEQAHA
jgi:hypothetical protein